MSDADARRALTDPAAIEGATVSPGAPHVTVGLTEYCPSVWMVTALRGIYRCAMAELGAAPRNAADVAALLDRTSPQVAPTRAELIAMGLLYTPEHGYAAFTVPHFDKFMKRASPNLEVPPVRRR